jgi:hypothetical protein
MVAVVALTAAGLADVGEKPWRLPLRRSGGSAYGIGLELRALFSLFCPDVPASQLIYGFPSLAMVTATATAAYGLTGYAVAMHGRRWRLQMLGAVAALYIVLVIGLRVVYRGQLLSAVIGGFAAGGCWLAVCVTGILTCS